MPTIDRMNSIAVIMTCHNRRDKTLTSLKALKKAAARLPNNDIRIFLTDDGCTDGTSEEVLALDDAITIVPGTGDLYWNRGMIAAWRAAEDAADEFVGYLLLNDDTIIDPDALKTLVAVNDELDQSAVVVGAVRDPITGEVHYGGVLRVSSWHPGRTRRLNESRVLQDADTFNANCVLVPVNVFRTVGTLDTRFRHGMGDYDYGLRVRRAGYRVVVAPGTVGVCERNRRKGTWHDTALPLKRRFELLNGTKGLPRNDWAVFLREHGAPLPEILSYIPTVKVILTSIYAFLRGSQSRKTDE